MFDNLTNRLQEVFSKLRASGRTLSEDEVKESLRTIRVALLEADVSLDVVRTLVKSIREKAVGEEVLKSVRPGDQVAKIVQDELVNLLGESDTSIEYVEEGPTIILMAGLQGSGKTTTCGKLAKLLSKRDQKKPLLAAADLQRPAAVDQLKTIGKQLGFPVYSEKGSNPIDVCFNAVAEAKAQDCDLVILDTAGRLHIDEDLMRELKGIHQKVSPHLTFLAVDAMTGQDATESASQFHKELPLDGLILTKLDSDTRGGAALSLRHVTGKPIKFAGVGEQMDKLEEFFPERMASRILGMGDVVSLVEKAQDAISEEEALEMQEKILSNKFNLEDFLKQLQTIKKMGSIKDLMGMLPGIGQAMKGMDIDDNQFLRVESLIQSMTPRERKDPDLLDGSRRKRIAAGAGRSVQEFNQFMNQFRAMQKMMSGLTKGKGGGMLSGMKNMLGLGKGGLGGAGLPPGLEGLGDAPGMDAALGGPQDQLSKSQLKKLKKEKKMKRKRSRGR